MRRVVKVSRQGEGEVVRDLRWASVARWARITWAVEVGARPEAKAWEV